MTINIGFDFECGFSLNASDRQIDLNREVSAFFFIDFKSSYIILKLCTPKKY